MFEKIKHWANKTKPIEDVTKIKSLELDKSYNDSVSLKKLASDLENEQINNLKQSNLYESEIRKEINNEAHLKALAIINVYQDKDTFDRAYILGSDDHEREMIEKKAGGEYEFINMNIAKSVESLVDVSKNKGVEIQPLDILQEMYSATEIELARLTPIYEWVKNAETLTTNLHTSETMAKIKDWEDAGKPEYRQKIINDAVTANPKIAEFVQSFGPIDYNHTQDFQERLKYTIRKESELKEYKITIAKIIKANYLLVDLNEQINYLKQTGYPKWLSRENANRYKN